MITVYASPAFMDEDRRGFYFLETDMNRLKLTNGIKCGLDDTSCHIRYKWYKGLSELLRSLTILRFPKIFYFHMKYFDDEMVKADKICEYVYDKFTYQPPYLEKSYFLSLLTKKASYRQYAFAVHVLLQFCNISSRLVAGECQCTAMNWEYHIWNECEAEGKTIQLDALNFQGRIPKKAYREWYGTDKDTSIALNLFFNEVFVARRVPVKSIWALKSRI